MNQGRILKSEGENPAQCRAARRAHAGSVMTRYVRESDERRCI